MKKIDEVRLKNMKGGFSIMAGLGIAAVIAFLAGFIEGYVHPRACGGD